MELAEFERGLCSCGWHESLTEDERNQFAIEEKVCPVCAAGDRYARIRSEQDDRWRKTLGDEPPANRKDPADGRSAFTRLTGRGGSSVSGRSDSGALLDDA